MLMAGRIDPSILASQFSKEGWLVRLWNYSACELLQQSVKLAVTKVLGFKTHILLSCNTVE
jgi:hypothetical protein